MDILSSTWHTDETREATCKTFTDFAGVIIKEKKGPTAVTEIDLRVRERSKDDLLFLDQLRAAVDEAIKWLRSR